MVHWVKGTAVNRPLVNMAVDVGEELGGEECFMQCD